MGGDSNSNDKRSSLDFFVPPEEGASVNDGDDANSYLERRLQKHKDYLKAAKNAQRTIDTLKQTQVSLDKAKNQK
jgi:hypothetical protein